MGGSLPIVQVMAALVKRATYAWYKGCEAALPALRLPHLLQLGAEACLMERMLSQLIRQPADKLFKAVRHHVANHVRSVSLREVEVISSISLLLLLMNASTSLPSVVSSLVLIFLNSIHSHCMPCHLVSFNAE